MASARAASLLLTVALVATGVAWWIARNASAPEPAVLPAAPEREVAEERAREDLVISPSRELDEAAAPDAAADRAPSARLAVPTDSASREDALFVEGRVVLPPGVPPDEELLVVASGRRFPSGETERSFPVDRDGRFRAQFAPGTRRGQVRLDARYLFLDEDRTVDLRELEGELVLEPRLGGRVHGRVLSPPLRPGEGDGLEETAASLSGTKGGTARRVSSDGRFELGPLRPASGCTLRVDAPSWIDARIDGLAVRAGAITEVEVLLERGASIAGRLLDPEGEPVEAARVDATSVSTVDGRRAENSEAAITDERGGFEIRGLRPGRARIAARVHGYPELLEPIGELAGGQVLDGLVLELGVGASVEGSVIWSDGRPAGGAEVVLVQLEPRPDGSAPNRMQHRTEAGDDGAFRFANLGAGPCSVTARARPEEDDGTTNARRPAEWEASLTDLRPGLGRVQLVLDAGLTVRGRVIDDRGRPLERFSIVVEPVQVEGPQPSRRSARFSSEDGRFALGGLAPGAWRMRAEQRDHAQAEAPIVALPAEDDEIELVLARRVTLSGRVLDPGGRPIEGAVLDRTWLDGGSANWTDPFVESREDGRFDDRRAAPGRFALTARAPGFAPSEPLELELAPGGRLEGLELRLRGHARIEGTLDVASDELAGRTVRATKNGRFPSETATTDARGTFAFVDLEPGSYVVELEQSERERALYGTVFGTPAGHRVAVELAPGETRRVVLPSEPVGGIVVRGRVTASGRAAAGWVVAWRAEGAEEAVRTVAGEDGAYRVLLDRPGDWRIMAAVDGELIGAEAVQVPDAPAFEHDLELPVGRLAGSVRDEQGRPLAGVQLRVWSTSPRDSRLSHPWRQQRTDERGRFAFDPLLAGDYLLESSAGTASDLPGVEYAGVKTSLSLAEGEVREDFDLVLAVGGTVEGRVVDGAGRPVPYVRVELRKEGGGPPGGAGCGTDSLGRFLLRGLSAGPHLLWAHGGEAESARRSVVVEAGRTLTVELVLDD